MVTSKLAYEVVMMRADELGYTPKNLEVSIAKFYAEGDATAYAIWRAMVNNERGDVFESRKGTKTVYRAG